MLNISARQQAMLKEMGIDLPWADTQKPSSALSGQPAPAIASADITQPQATPSSATPITGDTPAYIPNPLPSTQKTTTPHSSKNETTTAPTSAPLDTSSHTQAIAQMTWPQLESEVTACTLCKLCKSRTQTVFGIGNKEARIMIIGEAPGEQEDRQGQPFVGQAGKLLDRMLQTLNLSRTAEKAEHAVYIANVLKCRPPRNRNPELEEMALCEPFLKRQIELVNPRVIIAMGRFAVQTLLGTHEAIGRLRSRIHHYKHIPVIVTYHPAYLLRNPVDKRKSWADLCLMAETLHNADPEDQA